MKEVKVLAKDGQKLMSTDLERANKLIAKGEAEIVEASPLTIRMLKGTKRYMHEILKENYEYKESSNPYTIPLGKMNVMDEEKDFVWQLFSGDDKKSYPRLLVSSTSYSDKKMLIDNIVKHAEENPNKIVLEFCDVTGEYNYLEGTDTDVCGYFGPEHDIATVSEFIAKVMMDRFKLLEEKKVNNIFKVKDEDFKHIILCISDMNELMTSDDYKMVDRVRTSLGAIARLGAVVGINLLLMTNRASGSAMPNDLNCHFNFRLLLGDFNPGESILMFEKDMTDYMKQGRSGYGFVQYDWRDIYEVQLYNQSGK